MKAYYNEIDPYAAQWLRNLIAAGHIAPGDVDERSIVDVHPDDLVGYTQCHFFAGIGGWSYALRLAGWPDDRPVWTGSCPCQPFSAAGKRKGFADERHLWPEFSRLIRECRPSVVFGEQVSGAAGLAWLDLVFSDLEREGYACGAADIGAHSVGAPHRRQRLYWVADANSAGSLFCQRDGEPQKPRQQASRGHDADRCGEVCGMGNADDSRLEGRRDESRERAGECFAGSASPWRDLEWIACSDGKARPTFRRIQFVVAGLPTYGLAGVRAGEEGGEVDGQAGVGCSEKAVSALRQRDATQEVRIDTGGPLGFHAAQVLQPCVHGGGHDGRYQVAVAEEQQAAIRQDGRPIVRALWDYISSACSPCGQQPDEQQAVQLADAMRCMSHAGTLAAMEGDNETANALQALRQSCEALGSMQLTLESLSAAWRSACDEGQGGQWMGAGNWRAVAASPLSVWHPASRVGVLRGSGNAIVPQVAAAFVTAFVDQ